MINSLFKSVLLLSIAMLIFSACSQESKTAETEKLVAPDSTSAEVVEEENEVSYTLPSPLQLASIFKRSGLKYANGVANDPKNVTKYKQSDFIGAINLGIYSSDLAYVLLNKQFGESKGYLNACYEISAALGIKQAFETNNLGKRFGNNIGREDSLLEIMVDIQMESDIILEEQNKKHITAIAFAGGWIESIYIASKAYGSDKNKNIGISLMEQLTLAENIIKALNINQKKEPSCKKLAEDINSVLSIFKNAEAIKKANSEEEFDFTKITLTEREFSAIEKRINEIRTDLIK